MSRTSLLNGTSGDDVVAGVMNAPNVFQNYGWGADTLTGGNQNDTFHLTVDQLADFVNGGEGRDTVDYSGSGIGLMINLGEGTTRVWQPEQEYTSCAYTVMTSIENVIGSEANDTIVGSGADNVLDGGGGRDTFVFGRNIGNDVVRNFDARDSGEGNDLIRLEGVFEGWEDLQQHLHRDGDIWVIQVDDNNSITLTGVTGTLDASDFLFV
jgi:Ca2+-binding RTX toxin-like protein